MTRIKQLDITGSYLGKPSLVGFRLGRAPKTNHSYDLVVIGRKSLDLPAVGPQLEQSTSLGFDLRPELTRGVWDALLD